MRKILSIQSSVALGFVGNSVAAPVLTAMGHHPILVDTVKLAAHPGYGDKYGGSISADAFEQLLDGLIAFNALADISLTMTGYLGNAEQIAPIHNLITKWHEVNAKGIYILDPVIGDAGYLYVTPDIATGMRDRLLPLASVTTPNRFELAHLSGIEVSDYESADAAGRHLLACHPRLRAVVATAVPGQAADSIGDMVIARDEETIWLPPHAEETAASSTAASLTNINSPDISAAGPELVRNLPGGGDLLTAILAGLVAHDRPLLEAAQNASKTAQTIIAKSRGTRDLDLLAHLNALPASG